MPQVPWVLLRQHEKSVECRHHRVTAGLLLKSGNAPASLVSTILKTRQLEDFLIPTKRLKTWNVYPQSGTQLWVSPHMEKHAVTRYYQGRYLCGNPGHSCSWFHQCGYEPLLRLVRTEGQSQPHPEPLRAGPYSCSSGKAGQESSSFHKELAR